MMSLFVGNADIDIGWSHPSGRFRHPHGTVSYLVSSALIWVACSMTILLPLFYHNTMHVETRMALHLTIDKEEEQYQKKVCSMI